MNSFCGFVDFSSNKLLESLLWISRNDKCCSNTLTRWYIKWKHFQAFDWSCFQQTSWRKVVWRDIELISMWVSEHITLYKRPINVHESSAELVVSAMQEAKVVVTEVTSFNFQEFLWKIFFLIFDRLKIKKLFFVVIQIKISEKINFQEQHTLLLVSNQRKHVLKAIIACKPHKQSSNPTLDMSHLSAAA